MLGYKSKYTNITPIVEELEKYYKSKSSQEIIRDIVARVGRDRIQNLKKSITDIQRFLYKIKYSFDPTKDIETEEKNAEKDFLDIYIKKLEKLNLKDKDGKNKVFKEWKIPYYNLFFQSLENKTINLNTDTKYLSIEDFSLYDYHGNIIIYYIIRELTKLLNYNTDKYTKVSTAYFSINAINYLFGLFNEEDRLTNYEIQRFNYILTSYTYIHDVEESGHGLGGKTEGFYGEYAEDGDAEDDETIQQSESDIEESQALDIDGDLDYEIDYAPGVNSSN